MEVSSFEHIRQVPLCPLARMAFRLRCWYASERSQGAARMWHAHDTQCSDSPRVAAGPTADDLFLEHLAAQMVPVSGLSPPVVPEPGTDP